MSDWTLHLGDSIDGMRLLGPQSVDHVIADPPYEAEAHKLQRRARVVATGHAYESAEGRRTTCELVPLSFAAITEEQRYYASLQMARIVRRWVIVFCQVEATHKWRVALEAGGLQYVRTMVWIKPDAQPQFTGDRPGIGYESMVVAHPKGRKRWNGGGRVGVFSHLRERGANGEGAPHPTTKPLSLMRELVDLFTDPGELICDPFAGSGSTGVAARMLGRRFLGWELDPIHHATAMRRLSGEAARVNEAQPSLFGGP